MCQEKKTPGSADLTDSQMCDGPNSDGSTGLSGLELQFKVAVFNEDLSKTLDAVSRVQ